MTIFDVEVQPKDVLFALLSLPLVAIGLWAGLSLIYGLVPV